MSCILSALDSAHIDKIMSMPGIMVYTGSEIYFEKYSILTILFIRYSTERLEITLINAILLFVLNLFGFFIISNFNYDSLF